MSLRIRWRAPQIAPTLLALALVVPSAPARAVEFEYIAGRDDNWSIADGPENSTPSSVLRARIDAAYSFGASTLFDRRIDDFNDCFVHTFAALPDNIVWASLEVTMRPNGYAYNDYVSLEFTDPTGLYPIRWGHYLGAGNASPGLLSREWMDYEYTEYTFVLDLTDLPLAPGQDPTVANLIPVMNAFGFLDFSLQDDTGVDYLKLRIRTADTPEPPPFVLLAGAALLLPLVRRRLRKRRGKGVCEE